MFEVEKSSWSSAKRLSRGFTLIELLVVIAIIGVLASIVLASLDSTRKKGRDAKRLSDVKQLQLALELYYDNYNEFPDGDGATGGLTAAQLETPGYISKIPTDPSSGLPYKYVPYQSTTGTAGICVSYHLGATLETVGHSALTQDSDITNAATLGLQPCSGTGPANDFNGLTTQSSSANGMCTGVVGNSSTETCYDVRP